MSKYLQQRHWDDIAKLSFNFNYNLVESWDSIDFIFNFNWTWAWHNFSLSLLFLFYYTEFKNIGCIVIVFATAHPVL